VDHFGMNLACQSQLVFWGAMAARLGVRILSIETWHDSALDVACYAYMDPTELGFTLAGVSSGRHNRQP
jgi:hypothetical protein